MAKNLPKKPHKKKSPTTTKWRLPILLLITTLSLLAWMHREKWLPILSATQHNPTSLSLTSEETAINATLNQPEIYADETSTPSAPPAFTLDKSSIVSILLYHNFTDNSSNNAMVINVQKFRAQMQAIKDANIPVISLQDFLDWRRGLKNIPARSIIITIDDGWVATYTKGLPILKEFNFPFTLYLYTNYIAMGGNTLSFAQIKDIQASGGVIGSHSVSHKSLTSGESKGAQAYSKFLTTEIIHSKTHLEKLLGTAVTTFSYPYGNYSEHIAEFTRNAGYQAAVTVNGAKCTWETPLFELNRYVVHGNKDADTTFDNATTFRGLGSILNIQSLTSTKTGKPLQITLTPSPRSTILDRSPIFTADLSQIPNIEGATISLKIGGLGEVTPEYDPVAKRLTYETRVRFRSKSVRSILTVTPKGSKTPFIFPWEFYIDPAASFRTPVIPRAIPAPTP